VYAAGTVLAGKYRVDRVLGQGGMGTVVAATHLSLGQPLALKFLLPEHAHNPAVVERFVREARAAAALRSEHVCRVSDVGALDDGAPYIVMELLEGSDLASLLAAHGPLPVPMVCDYLLQACVGVAEAHALAIVHRDLKPANLFLTQRADGAPLIKVLDFGIAKAQSDTNFNITKTSSVLGSPGYMSPEQLRSSRSVDVRSDIWSLGVILYELVSGAPPFTGESITELAIRVTMDPTPPLAAPMPPGFGDIVYRCLAKDPAHRYPDLGSFAQALAAYAGPGGWELANVVARMLTAPRLSSGGMAPLAAPHASTGMAPITGPRPARMTPGIPQPVPPASHGAGTGGGHGTGPIVAPYAAPYAAPTTMGSAASSMVTGAGGRRRWGIFAGIAVGAVGAIVGIAITRGGSPTPAAAPPAPAPASTPAPTLAAAPADAAVPPDAPVDAAPAPTATKPPENPEKLEKPEKPEKPTRPGKPGKPTRPPTRPTGEDFGESRY
jgi:hypothetical protein